MSAIEHAPINLRRIVRRIVLSDSPIALARLLSFPMRNTIHVDMLIEKENRLEVTPPLSGDAMDQKIVRTRWTPKTLVLIGAAAIGCIALFYFLSDTHTKLSVEFQKLTVSEVRRGAFQEFIPVTGTVLPKTVVYLDLVQGGRIERKVLEQGAMVQPGDTILRLANAAFLLDEMTREAQLYDQISNLRNTRITIEQNTISRKQEALQLESDFRDQQSIYTRLVELQSQQLVSGQEFEQAEHRYEQLKKRAELARQTLHQDSLFRQTQLGQIDESMRRLQSNLVAVRQSLDHLIVRAPIAGQLSSLNAEIGQSKNAGDRAGQIDVLDSFKVRAGIDEYYLSRIQTGQSGNFMLGGITHEVVIRKVFPEVQNGRFDVDLEFLGDAPKEIRRGQTLQVRLTLGDLSEATLLARGGFYQKSGGQWVYVIDESGESATRRPIKLGRQNPDAFEVLDGLSAGQKVITSSYDSFGDVEKLMLKK